MSLAWSGGQRTRPGRLPRLPRHQPACRHDRQRLGGASVLTGTSFTDLTAVNGTAYQYVVVSVDAIGNRSAGSTPASVTPSVAAGAAVDLDGTNDYITFGAASPSLNVTSFTLETWFRRDGTGIAVSTGTGGIAGALPLVTKSAGEGEGPPNTINGNYFLGIDSTSGVLVADYEEPTGPNHPVSGTAVVTSNVWHHAAVTYNATTGTWKLYLDGVLDRTLVLSSAFQPNATSLQHAALGSSLTTTGTAAGFFNGALDEARIWNTARSDAQIAANFNKTLSAGSGLIARYGMNEGTGTTTASSVAGAPNGTLTNGPVWTAGPALTPGGNTDPVFSTDITDQSDAEGDSVSLDADATDADLDTLTYSATGLPDGVSIDSGTGVISGTLSGTSSGVHNVTITVTDGTGTDTDTFTWTVANANTPPVFSTNIGNQSDAEGDSVSLDADATDADLDTLTYSATGLPDGVSIDSGTGVISGTLSGTSSGVHNVTITVSDGTDTDTDTFTWTVANTNQAPVFSTDIANQSHAEGDPVSLDADATDADLDTLTYSATGLPDGASIDPGSGVISGTLSTSSSGTHNVTITVTDGTASDTDTFVWTVGNSNQAPVFSTDITDQSDTEGDTVNLDANASDADLDTLTYSATGLPDGVSIDSGTGVISGTLSGTSSGVHNVTITVTDGTGSDTDTFTWTVANQNQAPVFSTDIADQSDAEGDSVSLDADATDADLDTLTYSATGLPDGVSIDSGTGVISGTLSGTSSGVHNVTITVTDGTATDTDTFTWTVANANTPPVFSTNIGEPVRRRGRQRVARRRRDRCRPRHAHLQRHRPARRRLDRQRHGCHQRHPVRHELGRPQRHHHRVRRHRYRYRHVHLDRGQHQPGAGLQHRHRQPEPRRGRPGQPRCRRDRRRSRHAHVQRDRPA